MDRRKNQRNAKATPAAARLDDVNLRLLAELVADARLSLAELGRRVGLTAPAVAERLARLEETGVIRGYHAEIDPRALGYTLSAIVRVRPTARELATVAEVAAGPPRSSSATASPARPATTFASTSATSGTWSR